MRRVDHSTISGLADEPTSRPARWTSRLGIGVLVLVVAAGAVGLLGPRTREGEDTGGGYLLEVEYAAITRAGQPAPLHIRVTRESGFDGPVQIGVCDDWFDHLDFQSWYPTPSAETGSADRLLYEFDPPPGETLEISLDARTSPGQFGGVARCEVDVLEQDQPVVSVSFRTWRLP